MKAKKIYLIGMCGSGKSYLANLLSNKLKIDCIDLDDVFWIKKYSDLLPKDERDDAIKKAITGKNKWIIEGAYSNGVDYVVSNAEVIIWLDVSMPVMFFRIFKREIIKIMKKKNTFKDFWGLVKFLLAYKKPGRQYDKIQEILKRFKREIIILRSNQEIKNYLEGK